MGFGKGVSIAEDLWIELDPWIHEAHKPYAAAVIREVIMNYDCDNIDEAESLLRDALKSPTYFEEYILHRCCEDLDHIDDAFEELENLNRVIPLDPYKRILANRVIENHFKEKEEKESNE